MRISHTYFPVMFILFGLALAISNPSTAEEANQAALDSTDILYVTNRSPLVLENGASSYSSERSHSFGFGSVQVLGADASNSVVAEPIEIGRFPETPYSLEKQSDHYIRSSSVIAEHTKALNTFKNELSKRVEKSSSKEVIIFIHGYNNSFDDAVKSAAQLCNDLGFNNFVCVPFTWPAGGTKGILFGYNVDRESGEFSVPDLRKTIRMVADTKVVRKIHLIAHSRGADVLASTFQQLGIEAYAQKSNTSKRFKVDNIILAAPDMDIDVAYTRVRGIVSDPDISYGNTVDDRSPFYPDQLHLTVYTSSNDLALDTSKGLFGSDARLGQVKADDSGKVEALSNKSLGAVEYISVDDQADIIGHSYFLSNTSVRRDIVAIIRDHIRAGASGRSVVKLKDHYWKVLE